MKCLVMKMYGKQEKLYSNNIAAIFKLQCSDCNTAIVCYAGIQQQDPNCTW